MSNAAPKIGPSSDQEPQGTSSAPAGANFAASGDNNVSAKNPKDLPAFNITQHELTDRCRRTMVQFAGNDPGAVKRLANALECSIGTAKNYLEGRTTPGGIHDSRAMAVIPGYFKMKMELAGRAMEMDPDYQAKLVAFVRHTMLAGDAIFGGKNG